MKDQDYSDISIDIDLIDKAYDTTDHFDLQNSLSGIDLDTVTISDLDWTNMTSYTYNPMGAMGAVGDDSMYYSSAMGAVGAAGNNNGVWVDYQGAVGTTSARINVDHGGDVMIGDRSLVEFMNQVDERLGILRPNEGLESRWDQLKLLRQQYQELEKDLLEKEKIMDILKDNYGR